MKLLTNKTLKTFLILFITIYLVEIIFKLAMGIVFDWSLLRIAFSTAAFSALCALLLSFANNIVRNIFIIIIIVAASIYAVVQAGFNNYLGMYMSFATSSQAGAITDFIGEFIVSIKFEYWLILIPFVIFIVLFILFEHKINVYESNLEVSYIDKIRGKKKKAAAKEEQEKKKKKKLLINRIIFAGTFVVSCGLYYASLYIPFMQNDLQLIDNKTLFKNPSMPNIAVSQFGVDGFAFLDIKALIFPYDTAGVEDEDFVPNVINNNNNNQQVVIDGVDYTRTIDDEAWKALAESETVPDYKKLNNYYLSKEITPKNEYTGMFKDKNLIIVMIESGSKAILDYPEYFPTLSKLYNEGWSWDNAFSPRNACSTGNNEMSGITSLYTINLNCTANVYKENTYYEAIFNLFTNKEYNVTSYHDYDEHFYYRKEYQPNMGSQKYYNVDDLKIKKLYDSNSNQPWPSDLEFVQKALPKFIDEKKFMAWLTTVSSHMKYSYSSVTGDMYLDTFKDEKWNIQAKRYMSKIKIVDLALEEMLKELEETGRLEDTVIMLYADHEPYGLDQSIFQQIAKYDVKNSFGDVDRTPFIIYNPSITPQKYDTYTSFMDILPTIANLFDLDYDPRLYGGTDLFSPSHKNVVAFADGSWRTDIAFYNATSTKINYIGEKTYTPEEIKIINTKIKNEIAMNNLAIKRNYFAYLNEKLNIGFKPKEVQISNKIEIDNKKESTDKTDKKDSKKSTKEGE